MKTNCRTIYVSPNLNLRFSDKRLKKDAQSNELKRLVNLIKEERISCPKTIIFNYLLGIYQSNSWQSTKERVLSQFKNNGVKHALVATTALCMGVNFPDVIHVHIVNWGPAPSILDQHQEAGRAGRDGKKFHNIIIYHGQLAGHSEQEVKDFVHAKGCNRVAAYKTLDAAIELHEPLHNCCSFCSTICKCGDFQCDEAVLP